MLLRIAAIAGALILSACRDRAPAQTEPTAKPTRSNELATGKSVLLENSKTISIAEGDFYGAMPRCKPGTMVELPRSADEVRGELQHLTGFSIDRDVVTCAEFEACVVAKKCDREGTRCRFPEAVTVPIAAAKAYCDWKGARLPGYAEWQRAARLTDGRPFLTGTTWDQRCLADSAGERRRCAYRNELGFRVAVENPNVSEWTGDVDCVLFDATHARDPQDTSHVGALSVQLIEPRLNSYSAQMTTAEFRCATSIDRK
jgi:formylglycine-generating enzyme required for sulfatase activity